MKTLAKYHGYFVAFKVAGAWTLDPIADGWTQAAAPNADTFFSENYIDLAGMSMEEKTIVLDGITVQQCGFTTAGSAAGDSVLVYDIMTSIPIDLTNNTIIDAIVQRGAGFPGGPLNFEHVLYQRMQRWSLDLDFGASFSIISEEHQSGSMSPTASDRIYSYRILSFAFAGDGGAVIPPVRHLIGATAKEEPTYEYLMRLKRSYDLQQTDRD